MADDFSDSSISSTMQEIDEAALLELTKRMDRLEANQAELEVKLSRVVSGASKVLANLKEVLLAVGPQSMPIRCTEESPSKVVVQPANLPADNGTIVEIGNATGTQPIQTSWALENDYVDVSSGLDLALGDCVDVVFAEIDEVESDGDQIFEKEVTNVVAHTLFDEMPMSETLLFVDAEFAKKQVTNVIAHKLFEEMLEGANLRKYHTVDGFNKSADYVINLGVGDTFIAAEVLMMDEKKWGLGVHRCSNAYATLRGTRNTVWMILALARMSFVFDHGIHYWKTVFAILAALFFG